MVDIQETRREFIKMLATFTLLAGLSPILGPLINTVRSIRSINEIEVSDITIKIEELREYVQDSYKLFEIKTLTKIHAEGYAGREIKSHVWILEDRVSTPLPPTLAVVWNNEITHIFAYANPDEWLIYATERQLSIIDACLETANLAHTKGLTQLSRMLKLMMKIALNSTGKSVSHSTALRKSLHRDVA